VNTIPFGPRNPPEDPLLAKAAELPKDVAPPHDLWPGIAARLGEAEKPAARPFRWPLALAAAVLVASVSALLTWSLTRAPESGGSAVIVDGKVPPYAAPTDIVPVKYGPNSGLSAKDLVARDQLLAQFRGKFANLRPETRAAIVKNLEIMQKAADEIDAALAKDPASGMLKGMLVGTYKQELQLYSTVVTAGDGLTRRI
jgi:hypothetical protein